MVTKLVLTGGPSGGKTTLAQMMTRELGSQTQVVPEAASLIFGGGFPRAVDPPNCLFQQRAIYYVQRELEGLALATHPQTLLVCDRGSLDGLAYVSGYEEQFLQSLGTSEAQELARYQWVIHLDTAGPTQYDTHNPIRVENYQAALALNENVRRVWQNHPQRFVITNSKAFLAKVEQAMQIVILILQGLSYSAIQEILFTAQGKSQP